MARLSDSTVLELNMKALLITLSLVTGAAYAGDTGLIVPDVNQNEAPDTSKPGTPVYPKSSCIGAVVNGVCHGEIGGVHPNPKRCYGDMLNGRCTGPMF